MTETRTAKRFHIDKIFTLDQAVNIVTNKIINHFLIITAIIFIYK